MRAVGLRTRHQLERARRVLRQTRWYLRLRAYIIARVVRLVREACVDLLCRCDSGRRGLFRACTRWVV